MNYIYIVNGRRFSSWTKADNYRCLMGRPDWKITIKTKKDENIQMVY